jgi:hypothetical protein
MRARLTLERRHAPSAVARRGVATRRRRLAEGAVIDDSAGEYAAVVSHGQEQRGW